MSGNDFDLIKDLVRRIRSEVRPGPGDHLTPEGIAAFARVKRRPGNAVPKHLRECPWCWSRVFEVRKALARERVRKSLREKARGSRLRVPIALGEWAVQILAPVPGLQPAYAFSTEGPSAARQVQTLASMTRWEDMLPPSFESSAMFHASIRPLVDPDAAGRTRHSEAHQAWRDILARRAENTDEDLLASQAPVEPTGASIAPEQNPEQGTVSFALPVKGFDGRLTVTRQGQRAAMLLTLHSSDTEEPVPGAVLTLEHEAETFSATTNENGSAILPDVPLGGYNLSVEAPPAR